jgi:hypothetical protein
LPLAPAIIGVLERIHPGQIVVIPISG